jgi:hypothetical protein
LQNHYRRQPSEVFYFADFQEFHVDVQDRAFCHLDLRFNVPGGNYLPGVALQLAQEAPGSEELTKLEKGHGNLT